MITETPIVDAESIITREYMLVSFTGRCYRGKAKDRASTDKLTTDAGAKSGVAKVELDLFAGCGSEIADINNAINHTRELFYSMTQPWSLDDRKREGARLIANKRLFEFIAEYKKALTEVEARLATVEAVWDERVEQAKANLGALWREELYPSFDEVRRKWGMKIDYQPVPAATDFNRLSLPANVAEQMAERTRQRSAELVKKAIHDAYHETIEVVQRIANGTRVTDDGKKGKVYESTIDAMHLMIDNLRHFNITQEPQLEQYRQRLAKMMNGIDAKELRDNEDARGYVHTESSQIADDMLSAMQSLAA